MINPVIVYHKDYLKYCIPNGWNNDDNEDGSVTLYNDEHGKGALTLSFYSTIDENEFTPNSIISSAIRFADKSKIDVEGNLICRVSGKKTLLSFIGKDDEGWYVKYWSVAEFPRIVIATYYSEDDLDEIEIADEIISSIEFIDEED